MDRCQGVRDAKESRASELVCLVVPAGGVAGVVASMEWCAYKACRQLATSPCPVVVGGFLLRVYLL